MDERKRFGGGSSQGNPPSDPPDSGSQDDGEGEGEATFEEYIVSMIDTALEEGIPVGVSFDEELMTVMRSMLDATNKQTHAIKEQNRLFERVIGIMERK